MPNENISVSFSLPIPLASALNDMSHEARMNRSRYLVSLVLPAIEAWQEKNRKRRRPLNQKP